ncbi:hypothetical protein LTR56_015215 [Elasticomyces elasticus]|nr:hypothetical protein LTR56_015215 [Elasticomyces elasticus]KAK3644509.1 hypothetical protein LTR22_015229 [Elasticomyces elasticus]KAK4915546.1 hypothetical protein LTR49_016393 [Elasticomyces elasticus]KAK5756263.1 hypothetical protein LTS12_013687 [Elasticomyces elasticus]
MAIDFASRGPKWCSILLHLLVLITFATSAYSRHVVQDIDSSIKGLRAENTTSQYAPEVANLVKQPHSVEKLPGDKFTEATRKGRQHLCMLARDDVDQSVFTNNAALEDNGWTYVPADFRTAAMPADEAEVYDDLGISKENANWPWYEWIQQKEGVTKFAYGNQHPPQFPPGFAPGQEYGQTEGSYQNKFNPNEGLLLCLNNWSPQYKVDWDEGDGPIPPLNRLSDVLWLQWKDAVQHHSDNPGQRLGNIKWFYQHIVADADSRDIMDAVQAMPDHALKPYPGNEYSMTDPGIRGEIARAFLGSHNGNVVAFFLAQHRDEIGRKLTVSKVQFFGDAAISQYNRHFLFHVVPLSEETK